MKHPPLTSEQQATVVKWLPCAHKYANKFMARRRALAHMMDEADGLAYEAACRAALTWRPAAGSFATCLIYWVRHFVHMAECHYSRVVQYPRKWEGTPAARAFSLEASAHASERMHGVDVTWKDLLVEPRNVASSIEAADTARALHEHVHSVLLKRSGEKRARQSLEWWRRRAMYGDEFAVIASDHGVTRQAVKQRVTRVQRVVDQWAARVRREQEAA